MSPEGERREFQERLADTAVRFGDSSVDVADLVLLGLQLGWWNDLAERVRRGLALQSMGLEPITSDEVRARATKFRYDRRLVSASDFTAWLNERELQVADLSGVLTRLLLRQREQERVIDSELDPDSGAVLWAEAVCSYMLLELARAAADRLAAEHRVGDEGLAQPDPEAVQAVVELACSSRGTGLASLGEAALSARVTRLHRLDACLDRLRERMIDQEALSRCLLSHKLDWLAINGDEVILETEGAAREARMLVLGDGLPLTEAVERAGARIQPRRIVLDSAPAEASTELVAAVPGDLAGPWLESQRWRLMQVTAKIPPGLDQPDLRERASEELIRDLLDRTMAGCVDWSLAL